MPKPPRDEVEKAKERAKRLSTLKIGKDDDFLANIPPDRIITDYEKTDEEGKGIEYKRWIKYKSQREEKIEALRKFSGIYRFDSDDDPYLISGLPLINPGAIYLFPQSKNFTKPTIDQAGRLKFIEQDENYNKGKSLLSIEENKKRTQRVFFKTQILRKILLSESQVPELVITLSDYQRKLGQKRSSGLKYAPASIKIKIDRTIDRTIKIFDVPQSDIVFNLLIENTDISKDNWAIELDSKKFFWLDVDNPHHESVRSCNLFENILFTSNVITVDFYIKFCTKFFETIDQNLLRRQAVIDGGFEDAALFMSRVTEMKLLCDFLKVKKFSGDLQIKKILKDLIQTQHPLNADFVAFAKENDTKYQESNIYENENSNSKNLLNIIREDELKKCQEVAEKIKVEKEKLILIAEELLKSKDSEKIKIGIVKGLKLKINEHEYFCALGKEDKIYNIFILHENSECERIIDYESVLKKFGEEKDKDKKSSDEILPSSTIAFPKIPEQREGKTAEA